jgi:HAD superfamily hydrolase (TIGR01490 family)
VTGPAAAEPSPGISPEGDMPSGSASGRSAAFFDLDRTLMQGSSAFQFGRAAYRSGLMGRRQLLVDAWANLLFRLRGSNEGDTQALRNRISEALTGVRVRDLERLGGDVLAGILPRLYPQMLEVAYGHQDAGRDVYIVTAAAQELAELLAQVLRFDGAIGTRYSTVVDGRFTGYPAGPFIYRAGKAEAILELAHREGIDLARSYAYSDSESDLPMLRAVGHAVVVNPDAGLTRIARAEGWQILRLDRLRRRLAAGLAIAAAGLAGGAGSAAVAHRRGAILRPAFMNRLRR